MLFRNQNNCFLFEYILKCNLFLWCNAEFSASLLQSSVSHDPSEIILIFWFAAQLLSVIIGAQLLTMVLNIFMDNKSSYFVHYYFTVN